MQDVFRLGAPVAGGGRTQAALSQAGTVWEALVTYYLNLGYAGTDAVAVRRTELPTAVADALSVWDGPTRIAADVDSMVLYLPGLASLPDEPTDAAVQRTVASLFADQFRDATVVVLACKTTWADSIQTPMLWNLLYSLRRQRVAIPGGLAIGTGQYSLDALNGFSYAFITVPTQPAIRFKAQSLPVLRGRTMSGGHFWGRPTQNNIAPSLSEFFSRQAAIVRIAPPGYAGVALAREGRAPAGRIDLNAFDLI